MPPNDGISTTTWTNLLEIRGSCLVRQAADEPDILKPRCKQSK